MEYNQFMNNLERRCRVCGAFVGTALITSVELAIPIYCHECSHITEPHISEQKYASEIYLSPVVSTLATASVSASASPSPAPDESGEIS